MIGRDLDVGDARDDVGRPAVHDALSDAIEQRATVGVGEGGKGGRERARALLSRLEL